ncbi:hypothetical protein DO72_5163 [Burkholderia pseudomallei]|nr:hypothetical protein DO72_5163 [Burkholderia pseudomallei]
MCMRQYQYPLAFTQGSCGIPGIAGGLMCLACSCRRLNDDTMYL